MKHKLPKRSISNKHPHHKPLQAQPRRLSTPHDYNRTASPNKINSGIETIHSDSHTTCLKPNVPLKSQKLLKRDLLRCSNQRPSLLGPQTLQTPRIHHGSQQIPSVLSSSNRSNAQRQCSLSDNNSQKLLHTTIDRIGPWPDISINCLRSSDGNDVIQPLKNLRNTKNPRLFSPKYYAALNDNINKFKFHASKRSYIEEYRKQKGYVISSRPKPQTTSLSLSSSGRLQKSDDDQLSVFGTISGGTGSYTARDRTDFSASNLSISIGGIIKSVDDIIDSNRLPSTSNQSNILPSIPIRNNNHSRLTRPIQHQQTITHSSFQYLNNLSPIETVYDEKKKFSIHNQSKLFFIDGRPQKRYSIFFILFRLERRYFFLFNI